MKNFSDIPPLDAASVLKCFHIRADKSLGQNFLQDTSALENIALAAEIQEDDFVLEIGPGPRQFDSLSGCLCQRGDSDRTGPRHATPTAGSSQALSECARGTR